MRRYETIYILRPTLGEAEITAIIENTNQVIADAKGSIIDLNRWGMKKLAYLIKKETQGYYVFCDYAVTSEAVTEIERKFRIEDSVLKYMTVKLSDSITAEEVVTATSDAIAKIAAAKEAEEAEKAAAEEADAPKTDKAPAKTEESVVKEDAPKAEESIVKEDAPKAEESVVKEDAPKTDKDEKANDK